MGQKDLTEKNLEFHPDVFADILNALMYGGERIVIPEELLPAPTETLHVGSDSMLHNQFHDVSKYVQQNGTIQLQYTLENETRPKRKTVLRKASYEGAVYREQYNKPETYPVISALLYWGTKRWRHPKSLKQLWKKNHLPDVTQRYIDNVKLHVYDMQHLSKEIRCRFRSDMRIIVDYLAEGKDYIPTNQKILHPEALLLMLKALTGDDRFENIITEMEETELKGGNVTMCELLDKYEARGIARGRREGRSEGRKEDIRNLMDTMKWTAKQAMTALKIPAHEWNSYLAML